MGEWVFAELQPESVRRDPNETELFKTAQAEEGEYAGTDALVREIIQNSLDARAGDDPVRVRLSLHAWEDAPPRDRLAHYFRRLKPALTARGFAFDSHGAPRTPCKFLVCEDFETRGLGGNPLLARDPPPGDNSRQDFFWFWRNIGRSGKTGEDLGRWGLGKTVYRAASRVGCMLGLTIRNIDRQQLLMGQAVLRIHQVEGKEYVPEGFWCHRKPGLPLPHPIQDKSELRLFREEWQITRTNEPGLSVVVPYVADELRDSRILQAVAVHFFVRILRGELVVEVAGPEIGEVTLDANQLERACNVVEWDGPKRTKRHVAPPVAFARKCIEIGEPENSTGLLGERGQPILDETVIDATKLATLRHEFSAGGLVSLRVSIRLFRMELDDCEGYLDVHLQRQADGHRCDSYYVRDGMTITKLNSRAALRGVDSLVLVDSGPLSSLLGDSEGPAHEDWDTSEDRPDRTWRNWKGRVKFVRRIVDAVVELLNPPSDKPDFNLLSDYFSIEEIKGPQRKVLPSNNGKKDAKLNPIVGKPQWFRVTARSGGFTVSPTRALPVPLGIVLQVSIAYDLPSGDPLRAWSPFDFQLAPTNSSIRLRGRNVLAEIVKGNIVEMTIEEPEFSFTAEGFDVHRDLYVRVEEVREEAETGI